MPVTLDAVRRRSAVKGGRVVDQALYSLLLSDGAVAAPGASLE